MIEEITRKTGLPVQVETVIGRKTTTMAVGGAFQYFVEPNTLEELRTLVSTLHALGQPYRVLGGGSNLIVSDEGVRECIIRLGRGFRGYGQKQAGVFEVQGSTSLMTLSREMSEGGFSGLEFAGGIPASFGGAVRMNAGAHGGSISDIIEKVWSITPAGDLRETLKQEMHWSYRKSDFSDGSIVVSAEIKLTPGDKTAIQERRAHFLMERKKRQPLSSPSAGSVFKNPGNDTLAAGAILERIGMKGARSGNAEISMLHANWIINPQKNATANDVENLITKCQEEALAKEGIQLEREVIRWA